MPGNRELTLTWENATPAIDHAFAQPASEERIQRTATALRGHGFTVHVVDGLDDARGLVLGLLPAGRSVFTATSETLRDAGLDKEINESGRHAGIRPQLYALDRTTQLDEARRLTATPDVIVGSVQAVTEDGAVVMASASGSQLAAYASGAGAVIWVVGAQKVVADLPTALRRIETYAYPLEDRRARTAYGRASVVAKLLIVSHEVLPGRATLVLVRQSAGY